MIVVVLSVMVLLLVSNVGEPRQTIQHGCIACAAMLVLYVLAFLVPLWRCFGFRRVIGLAVTLTVAWVAVALALVADALPLSSADKMEHPWKWAMILLCIAALSAFFLFFQGVLAALRSLDELVEARREEP